MKKLLVYCLSVISTLSASAQSFDNFSNFHIVNGAVFWQNIYHCPGVNSDSLLNLVVSAAKADATYTLIAQDSQELNFEIRDKAFEKGRFKYSGRVAIQIKEEKYRLTFNSMTSRAGERQIATQRVVMGTTRFIPERNYFDDFATDKEKRYFRQSKLQHLTTLNGQFVKGFDYINNGSKQLLTKDW